MHIEDLVQEIIDVVNDGFNLKLFHRTIVEGERIVEAANEITKNLPDEFESAKRITADREKIIQSAEQWAINKKKAAENEAAAIVDTAKRDADNMIADAEAQARYIVETAQAHAAQLVSESNITKTAHQQAQQLVDAAKADSDMMMNAARANSNELTAQAEQWANDVRTGAYEYAMRMVNEVDNYLSGSVSDLRQTKLNLENMQ